MSVMVSIVRDKRAMRRSGLGSGVAGDEDMANPRSLDMRFNYRNTIIYHGKARISIAPLLRCYEVGSSPLRDPTLRVSVIVDESLGPKRVPPGRLSGRRVAP
jgi:hypothetical protein